MDEEHRYLRSVIQQLGSKMNQHHKQVNERLAELERNNLHMMKQITELNSDAFEAMVKLRSANNVIRTLSMELTEMSDALMPTVYDFRHDVSQAIGEPVYTAPERFALPPKLPAKS